ncbi:MAG: VOC family protein [Eubacteriaceae bacterium]
MKYKCALIVVSDINISRNFYENLLNQKVKFDFGENVTYEGDFSIQLKSHYASMITINKNDINMKSNNFELYFEDDNIDEFITKLNNYKEILFIHGLIEHSWGQRVIRFYDPDMHIIEVGESMESVFKRYNDKGFSIEEIADLTQHPIEFIKKCL